MKSEFLSRSLKAMARSESKELLFAMSLGCNQCGRRLVASESELHGSPTLVVPPSLSGRRPYFLCRECFVLIGVSGEQQ